MKAILTLLLVVLHPRAATAFSRPSVRPPAASRSAAVPTRLHSSAAARPVADGVTKTTTAEGTGRQVRPGDAVVVKYTCAASGSDVAFARASRQRMVACDGTMIRGWDAAIRTMREGERASVTISDPAFGYGAAGVPPFVPPDASIDVDMEVIAVEEGFGAQSAGAGSNTDATGLDGMLDGPANRPRTPGAIAAAYEARMREKAVNAPEEKEGIEGFVDWIKNSYFFGLFEGETGQEAPWYLKPSITFPIAFLVVGAAFWASLAGGAISERGMPSTDELDEIIVSSNVLSAGVAVAMSSMIQV